MSATPLTDRALDLVASRFRLLGEPARLRLLQELQAGERSVAELTGVLGTSQPNVSKHLKLMLDGGLVARRGAGTTVFYRVVDPMVYELCDLVCNGLRDELEREAAAFPPTRGLT